METSESSVEPTVIGFTARQVSGITDLSGRQLRYFEETNMASVSLQTIRKAVGYLRNSDSDGLASTVLAIHGDDIVMVTLDQTIVSLVKNPDQLYFVIDIDGIRQQLVDAIASVG